MVLGLGIVSGELTSYDQLVFKNALRQARQFWEEDATTGAPIRDNLANPDPLTGQPNSLDPGRRAASVVLVNGGRYRSGTWVLTWSGTGTVQIDWANGVGPMTDSSAHRIQATIATPTDGFQLRILATNPADPVRLLALTHIDDEGNPAGFQPWWMSAWRVAGNRCFRALDWMWGQTLLTTADVRPDTWWTESDEALDSYAVLMVGDLTSSLGQRRDIYRGGGSVGYGIIVRGIQDGWHFRIVSGSVQIGDELRAVGAATGPVVTSVRPAETGSVGCSIGLLVEVQRSLDVDLWITASVRANDAYYTHLATRLRNEGLSNRKVFAEYGNEAWNPVNDDYPWLNQQGVALNMPGPNAWEKGGQFYALRAEQMHDRFREVFTGANAGRLETLYGLQHEGSEYWYTWRTIINPENDPTYPQWPRRVCRVDNVATAPYFRTWKIVGSDRVVWNNADFEANDDTQLEQNLRDDQIYAMRAASGSAPFRGGGLGLWQTLVSERQALQGRPCKLICYEGGQEMYAPGDATTATRNRIRSFQNSVGMGRLFDEFWARLDAGGLDLLCAFNSDGSWGDSLWFGLYDNPIDGAGLTNDVKYMSWLRWVAGDNPQLPPIAPSSHWDRSRLGRLQIVQTGPINVRAAAHSQHDHSSRAGHITELQAVRLVALRSQHTHTSRLGAVLAFGGQPQYRSLRSRHTHSSRLGLVNARAVAAWVSVRGQAYTCTTRSASLELTDAIRHLRSVRSMHWSASRLSSGTALTPQGSLKAPLRRKWTWQPGVIASHIVMPGVVIWEGAAVGLTPTEPHRMARPFQPGDAFAGFANFSVQGTDNMLARITVRELGAVQLEIDGLNSHAPFARLIRVLGDDRFDILPPDADFRAENVAGRLLVWIGGHSGLVFVAARSFWDGKTILVPAGVNQPVIVEGGGPPEPPT